MTFSDLRLAGINIHQSFYFIIITDVRMMIPLCKDIAYVVLPATTLNRIVLYLTR